MKHPTTTIVVQQPDGRKFICNVAHFMLVGLSEEGSSLTFVQSHLDAETSNELLEAAGASVVHRST